MPHPALCDDGAVGTVAEHAIVYSPESARRRPSPPGGFGTTVRVQVFAMLLGPAR